MTTYTEAKKAWDDLMRSPQANEVVRRLFYGERMYVPLPPSITLSGLLNDVDFSRPAELPTICFVMERGEVASQDDRRRAYRVVTTEGHMVAIHVMSQRRITAGAAKGQSASPASRDGSGE